MDPHEPRKNYNRERNVNQRYTVYTVSVKNLNFSFKVSLRVPVSTCKCNEYTLKFQINQVCSPVCTLCQLLYEDHLQLLLGMKFNELIDKQKELKKKKKQNKDDNKDKTNQLNNRAGMVCPSSS